MRRFAALLLGVMATGCTRGSGTDAGLMKQASAAWWEPAVAGLDCEISVVGLALAGRAAKVCTPSTKSRSMIEAAEQFAEIRSCVQGAQGANEGYFASTLELKPQLPSRFALVKRVHTRPMVLFASRSRIRGRICEAFDVEQLECTRVVSTATVCERFAQEPAPPADVPLCSEEATLYGEASLRAVPGAEVYRDGEWLGRTPLQLRLPAGCRLNLTFESRDRVRKVVSMVVPPGGVATRTVAFPER